MAIARAHRVDPAVVSQGRLLGRFFAASRKRPRQVAERLRLKRVPNLGGCPAS